MAKPLKDLTKEERKRKRRVRKNLVRGGIQIKPKPKKGK